MEVIKWICFMWWNTGQAKCDVSGLSRQSIKVNLTCSLILLHIPENFIFLFIYKKIFQSSLFLIVPVLNKPYFFAFFLPFFKKWQTFPLVSFFPSVSNLLSR